METVKEVAVYSSLSGVLKETRSGGLGDRIWQPNLIQPLMVYYLLWKAQERTNLITTTSSTLLSLSHPLISSSSYLHSTLLQSAQSN